MKIGLSFYAELVASFYFIKIFHILNSYEFQNSSIFGMLSGRGFWILG